MTRSLGQEPRKRGNLAKLVASSRTNLWQEGVETQNQLPVPSEEALHLLDDAFGGYAARLITQFPIASSHTQGIPSTTVTQWVAGLQSLLM